MSHVAYNGQRNIAVVCMRVKIAEPKNEYIILNEILCIINYTVTITCITSND